MILSDGKILDLMMEVFFELYPKGRDSDPPPPSEAGPEFDSVCDEIYGIALERFLLEDETEPPYVH